MVKATAGGSKIVVSADGAGIVAQADGLPGHPARRTQTAPAAPAVRPGKLSRHARELRLRLAAAWLWADYLAAAIIRLQELPNPR